MGDRGSSTVLFTRWEVESGQRPRRCISGKDCLAKRRPVTEEEADLGNTVVREVND